MNNRYRLIIFDLDGTIADTSFGILNCVRYTQRKMQLPAIPLEQMRTHLGPPMSESYNRNFGLEGKRLDEAVSLHKQYALERGFNELEIYDGMREVIDNLKKRGYTLAVATLKADEVTRKIFDSRGMTQKFDIIVGTDTENPKTKAELIEYCIEKSNYSKNEAILIGDSKYDALGAREVGIDFLGATYGFGFKCQTDVDVYQNVGSIKNCKEILSFF